MLLNISLPLCDTLSFSLKFSFELLITLYLSIIKEWGFWFSVYSGKIYLNSLIKEIKKENRFWKMQYKKYKSSKYKSTKNVFEWFFFYFSWCVMINCKIKPTNVKTNKYNFSFLKFVEKEPNSINEMCRLRQRKVLMPLGVFSLLMKPSAYGQIRKIRRRY